MCGESLRRNLEARSGWREHGSAWTREVHAHKCGQAQACTNALSAGVLEHFKATVVLVRFDPRSWPRGMTPLHIAAWKGDVPMARHIVKTYVSGSLCRNIASIYVFWTTDLLSAGLFHALCCFGSVFGQGFKRAKPFRLQHAVWRCALPTLCTRVGGFVCFAFSVHK